MTFLFYRITGSCDKSRATRAMTLDISKVHDVQWHACLPHRFKSYGIPGQVFGVILSILNNRLPQVVLDGNSLQEFLVNVTVPQCSNFGPILFLLYINDLLDVFICDIAIYADDTTHRHLIDRSS